MGASADWVPVYGASGMHNLYIGDEAVVDVRRFSLDGKQNKSLRQSVGRVEKAGYRVEFVDPAHLEPGLEAKLRELMTESRRGDVERGFSMTLGRVFEADDRGLLLAVALDREDRPAGFCQYVPARGIRGWSLDLMRRSEAPGVPNGITEFIVAKTIEHVKAEGSIGLALNFATFRAVLASEAGDRLVQRAQKWILERVGDSMQIESLWTFNEKFQPEWHPRYAAYDSPEHHAERIHRGGPRGVVLRDPDHRPLLQARGRRAPRSAAPDRGRPGHRREVGGQGAARFLRRIEIRCATGWGPRPGSRTSGRRRSSSTSPRRARTTG